MSKDERWVYRGNKLTGKETTYRHSDGCRTVVHQKAHSGVFGRSATNVTSRIRYTK